MIRVGGVAGKSPPSDLRKGDRVLPFLARQMAHGVVKSLCERRGALVACLWRLRECSRKTGLDMPVRDEKAERLPVWVEVGNDGSHHIVEGAMMSLGESNPTDENGQERNGGREDVGAAVHRQAPSLFGGHVLRGTADIYLCRSLSEGRSSSVHGGDVEVEQHWERRLSDAVGRKPHTDVVRFYIHVDESCRMDRLESVQ